jgi:hypothetical protein
MKKLCDICGLCVKYKNNHHTDIISSRKERRERKDSCPVTLALEKSQLRAKRAQR